MIKLKENNKTDRKLGNIKRWRQRSSKTTKFFKRGTNKI